MKKYNASYKGPGLNIHTNNYTTPQDAWDAIVRRITKLGKDGGELWHRPGAVAGDSHTMDGRYVMGLRGGGTAFINEVEQ